MQVLSSQKQITKCESTAFSGTRFPFDRYAGFHYSGFTVYFAPVYSLILDSKKPTIPVAEYIYTENRYKQLTVAIRKWPRSSPTTSRRK